MNANTIQIFINSSRRADRVVTLEQLPRNWRRSTAVVVPRNEARDYYATCKGWDVVAMPADVPPYVSSQRHWVMQTARVPFVFIMDDDLVFKTRGADGKLRNSTHEDMSRMLSLVARFTRKKNVGAIGISHTFVNGLSKDKDVLSPGAIGSCFVLNREAYVREGCVMSDFEPWLLHQHYINIQLLSKGYDTYVLMAHAFDQTINVTGGVSRYRTPALLEKVCQYLADKYPDYVTVTEKTNNPSAWPGFPVAEDGKVHVANIKVAWKKLAEHGKRQRHKGIREFV